MKRFKVILVVLIILGTVGGRSFTVHASENRIMVVSAGNRMVEELSEEEAVQMSLGMSQEIIGGTVSESMTSNSSYTAYRYSESFNFYLDDLLVARADAECIVWHYTDGKVHLYSRSIGISRLAHYDAARIYGSIVNTDGSYSYTTGDRVHLFLDEGTWVYAIDFYVSNTDAYFTCYEV